MKTMEQSGLCLYRGALPGVLEVGLQSDLERVAGTALLPWMCVTIWC